jgi:hypothetical protein
VFDVAHMSLTPVNILVPQAPVASTHVTASQVTDSATACDCRLRAAGAATAAGAVADGSWLPPPAGSGAACRCRRRRRPAALTVGSSGSTIVAPPGSASTCVIKASAIPTPADAAVLLRSASATPFLLASMSSALTGSRTDTDTVDSNGPCEPCGACCCARVTSSAVSTTAARSSATAAATATRSRSGQWRPHAGAAAPLAAARPTGAGAPPAAAPGANCQRLDGAARPAGANAGTRASRPLQAAAAAITSALGLAGAGT